MMPRLFVLLGLVLCLGAEPALGLAGMVVDAVTQAPLAGVSVTTAQGVVKSDGAGRFRLALPAASLSLRAAGYRRRQLAVAPGTATLTVALQPFRPKALYLSFYGVGSTKLRGAALRLIERTELNALVIDVKGDRGQIAFPSPIPERAGLGPQKVVPVRDMAALVRQLQQRGVYLIARIVVFKDQPFASAHPALAVHDAAGGVWHDREGMAWSDPFSQEAWRYNLDIAEAAARLGFDEIQFDYLRFPDTAGLVFSRPNTRDNRVGAILGFLTAARQRLAPYNVFVAADVFGYVCWNENDTFIGQQIERLGAVVDYLSPMLYPSGFTWGIPGYRNPVANPGEIVERSLRRAMARTALPGVRFRPWLQSFRDYAFDRRPFGAREIRAQIDAAEAVGSGGWMLWNPRNQYSEAGLKLRAAAPPAAAVPAPGGRP